jgi:branched-chain amino acid transport system ATP-binding protein
MACLLQENSVFPDMTVEENLRLGAYLMNDAQRARQAAERIFDRYPSLAARRARPARVLSGGERRLLEISRALMMDPQLLLIDEPSIGLEPRYIDMVFEILLGLRREGRALLTVEQNARKGLEAADIGCVVIAGEIAMVGTGQELLHDPAVGRLFLGG